MSADGTPPQGFVSLVVEDVADTRDWLCGIAREVMPGAPVRAAASCAEALHVARSERVALALLDLRLPDGSGLDALRAVRAAPGCAGCICVVTTVLGGDADIVSALAAGADGYVTKEAGRETIARQVRLALSGVPALSPAVARRIMDHFAATGPRGEASALTRREREVLGLIGSGLRNAEAAETLGISPETVSGHVKAIYGKLGISSRAEAAWHAASMGLAGPQRR